MTSNSNMIRTGTRRRFRIGNAALPYVLVLPTLLFVTVFTLLPTIRVFYDSLFIDNQATRTPMWTGTGNYNLLLNDFAFKDVLTNTFIYVVITVPISIFLALVLALVLNQKIRALGLYRLAFFYPTVLPMVSAATIWLFMYTPGYGLFNVFIGLFGIPSQNWLGSAKLALSALMILGVWKQTGYFMIFYLAGLQGLPHEIFEAADLDGASTVQKTRFLTIPLLMGTTLFVTTIAVVNAFSTVDQIYLMTGGGPVNSSSMLLFEIYNTLFKYIDAGKANAMSVILIAILFVFSALNFYFTERRATYE